MNSESFNLIYKKLKDGVVSKGDSDYDRLMDSLSRISGINSDEIE